MKTNNPYDDAFWRATDATAVFATKLVFGIALFLMSLALIEKYCG